MRAEGPVNISRVADPAKREATPWEWRKLSHRGLKARPIRWDGASLQPLVMFGRQSWALPQAGMGRAFGAVVGAVYSGDFQSLANPTGFGQ